MDRRWMYDAVNLDRHGLKDKFVTGVAEFVEKAMARPSFLAEGGIRCPCIKCKCIDLATPREVNLHLYRDGFMPNYYVWTKHGEDNSNANLRSHASSGGNVGDEDQLDAINQMIHDANTGNETFREDEEPNSEAQHFYDTLISANQPIYEGATESKLSISVKLLAARSNWKVPQKGIDFFAKMLCDVCPTKHCFPENNYQATQLVSKLGLKARKIDCCVNGCLLFYKEDNTLTECRICGAARYVPRKSGMGKFKDVPVKRMFYFPIIPRLQRLYASTESAAQMRWHHENIKPPNLSTSNTLCFGYRLYLISTNFMVKTYMPSFFG